MGTSPSHDFYRKGEKVGEFFVVRLVRQASAQDSNKEENVQEEKGCLGLRFLFPLRMFMSMFKFMLFRFLLGFSPLGSEISGLCESFGLTIEGGGPSGRAGRTPPIKSRLSFNFLFFRKGGSGAWRLGEEGGSVGGGGFPRCTGGLGFGSTGLHFRGGYTWPSHQKVQIPKGIWWQKKKLQVLNQHRKKNAKVKE